MERGIWVATGIELEHAGQLRRCVEVVGARREGQAAEIHSGEVGSGGLAEDLIISCERSGMSVHRDGVIDMDGAIHDCARREARDRAARGEGNIAAHNGRAGVRDGARAEDSDALGST
jgi:hypothetical protein